VPTGGHGLEHGGHSVRLGQIEYVLARESIVREFRRGRLSRLDVCDAQPELIRVASNLGRPTEVECPICADSKLVHVTFAFGPRLPPSGMPIASPAEFAKIAGARSEIVCYIVEVCTGCRWNHLVRTLAAGRRQPSDPPAFPPARQSRRGAKSAGPEGFPRPLP
jgi:hypothetical protein